MQGGDFTNGDGTGKYFFTLLQCKLLHIYNYIKCPFTPPNLFLQKLPPPPLLDSLSPFLTRKFFGIEILQFMKSNIEAGLLTKGGGGFDIYVTNVTLST